MEANMPSTMKVVLIMLAFLASSAARAQDRSREGPAWKTFSVPEFGLTVQYPAGIFSVVEGKAEKGVGRRFSSADGRSLLDIYSRPNDAGDSPASYLRNNLRVSRATLSYARVTHSFFAIATRKEGSIYYSRCNFSFDRDAAIHCIDLVYPEPEKRAWDSIVTRISRSLRPLEG
jgi:hypothetical protein